ncbi:hypothetical protein VP01_120g6 [Puccinia sorghi]|uniref:Uncharacterized protein n=1 Tax=Puccinia sorghi TaxID=27349 RepID=A0A0L6VRT3_9BASI|nr:hypothetical protein VP01_120g6 [Puccinia sorghi]
MHQTLQETDYFYIAIIQVELKFQQIFSALEWFKVIFKLLKWKINISNWSYNPWKKTTWAVLPLCLQRIEISVSSCMWLYVNFCLGEYFDGAKKQIEKFKLCPNEQDSRRNKIKQKK